VEGFESCFEDLEDPRTGNAGLHDLLEMLFIALCTVLSGGQSAVDMAMFAREKETFLREFLKLEHGLPSHDTFSRIFRLLDPEQFRACFQRFMARFAETCQGVIAIDGKVVRRSFDKASGKSALHMVSAWGCDQRLVLAQIATDAKSNEITAVPKLLKMLCLKGTIVTVDALNCQREIAQQIIEQGGDYALALKGNQGTLHADVSTFLDDPKAEATTANTTVDADHAALKPAPPSSRPMSIGCKNSINGQDCRRSQRSPASARPPIRPPAKPPTTCSANRSRPSASILSPGRTGVWKIASTGALMLSCRKIGPETVWTMDLKISPCCATWLSTSCARIPGRLPSVGNSRSQPGTTIISSTSYPSSEMRLPCTTPSAW